MEYSCFCRENEWRTVCLHLECTLTQTDCRWCLQPGVATRAIPSCLNGQSGHTILHVMSGSNPVAGTVCPKLHWWYSCIFDVKYLMGNVGAGWQGWKATSMPGTRDLISILMQNSDYTLSAIPQGRTFNEKKRLTFQASRIKFYQKMESSLSAFNLKIKSCSFT